MTSTDKQDVNGQTLLVLSGTLRDFLLATLRNACCVFFENNLYIAWLLYSSRNSHHAHERLLFMLQGAVIGLVEDPFILGHAAFTCQMECAVIVNVCHCSWMPQDLCRSYCMQWDHR